MSKGGYLLLYRSLFEGDIPQVRGLGWFFIVLLFRANYAPSTILWNGRPRTLKRGQALVSIRGLADECMETPNTIVRFLRYLQDENNTRVCTETCTHGTIVTILNYDRYQLAAGSAPDTNAHANVNADVYTGGYTDGYYHNKEIKKERINNNAQTKVRAIFPDKKFIEEIYSGYPRKMGKTKGLTACRQKIKTETDFQNLKQAVTNYREWVNKEKVEDQYIKHFSTFMNSWQDWLDPQTGTNPQKEELEKKRWEYIFGEEQTT